MEVEVEVSAAAAGGGGAKPDISYGGGVRIERENASGAKDRVRVKRKTLEAVLEQCQRALELLSTTGCVHDDDEHGGEDEDEDEEGDGADAAAAEAEDSGERSPIPCRDKETDEFCDLLKSRVECPDFLEKLESAKMSVPQSLAEEGSSWDIVNENDLWEDGNNELDKEDYFVVRQEDIVDGIACFMATYLLSLKQTKDLTPNQLQEALSKTFSVKRKKGKLRRAWNGSKVIYNVASWGATAIGMYQNPALLRAASAAFWTSCQVISKLF